ncbi:oxidoreductase [Gemmobacter serpentinus]|uniref:oxidoreductase n=1 Tax=Gemmobacter serpentinus TaxID=2652247 RepID=UPI00124C1000|nr:oxidoreductase [Gemmobacter serpentinus]
MQFINGCLTASLIYLMSSPAYANEILLHVSNQEGQTLALDRLTLETLPQKTVKTSTIWTDGVIEFSGPVLIDVLHQAGIDSGRVEFLALNDYRLEMEVADFSKDWPIIATRREGEPFGIRENGPLWVIYPFDEGGQLSDERTFAASVWQLVKITELP